MTIINYRLKTHKYSLAKKLGNFSAGIGRKDESSTKSSRAHSSKKFKIIHLNAI